MARTRLVTLLITRECNLRCSYCYVRFCDGGTMSFETARRCVENEFRCAVGRFDRVEIAFLGGEPFFAFGRLREICEWIWENEWPLPYVLSASTNGTLITGEVKRWLAANRERFYPSLSYDGSLMAQDSGRCGTAGMIDTDFFAENWPEIPVKMTVTEESVPYLYRNIQRLRERGLPVNDTFADGVRPWRASSLRILDGELQKLCDAELSHPSRRQDDLLGIDLTRVLGPDRRQKFECGAGEDRVTYDVDGEAYACHLLSPLALDGDALQRAQASLSGERPASDMCLKCELDGICPSCEGCNARQGGNCRVREEKTCELFRHQLLYACMFQMKRLLRKERLTAEDKAVFLSIQKIMGARMMKKLLAERK